MEEKFLTNRQKKALETRKKIYDSAKYLFNIKGFDDVNVDEIVKLAKVAKGSFYVHFKSKDELISLLIQDYVKRVDTDYREYIERLPSDTPVSEVLLGLVGKIADVISETIGYEKMRNLYKTSLTDDESNAATDYNRELYLIFKNIIEKGIKVGEFHTDLPIEELARHFVSAYRGLTFEWCIRYPVINLKEQAIKHFKIMLSGIKNRNA